MGSSIGLNQESWLIKAKLIAAFLAIYLIWGSTFLAIKFVVTDIPPFIFGGVRFLIAGSILFAWSRFRGGEMPTIAHWKAAAITGGALLLVAHGLCIWAVQFVPSGLTTLLVSTAAVWMAVPALFGRGSTLTKLSVLAGIVIGLLGIVLLARPFDTGPGFGIEPAGIIALVISPVFWAAGSIYSSRAPAPKSGGVAASIQMLCGGLMLFVAGAVSGELARFSFSSFTLRSAISFVYLIIFGSLIAFSAYSWLLKNSSTAMVGSHAFVNPVVALYLGFALAEEILTTQDIVAAGVILFGVILITIGKSKKSNLVSEYEQPEDKLHSSDCRTRVSGTCGVCQR